MSRSFDPLPEFFWTNMTVTNHEATDMHLLAFIKRENDAGREPTWFDAAEAASDAVRLATNFSVLQLNGLCSNDYVDRIPGENRENTLRITSAGVDRLAELTAKKG